VRSSYGNANNENNQRLRTAFIIVSIYLALATILFVFQRALLYFPTAEYEYNFEQITLQNDGVNLQIIVLNKGKASALIYFGGNAEAVIFNALKLSNNFPNKTIYLVNYRGYGGSSGKPTSRIIL
jgi:hypothetical protein